MRTLYVIPFIIGGAFMGAGTVGADQGPSMPALTITDSNLIDASNQFGLELFQKVVGADLPDANVFISPMSVSYALAMTLNGAEGETGEAIAATLRLTDLTQADINQSFKKVLSSLTDLDPSVTFDIANSIWYRSGLPIRSEFVEVNKTFFQADVRDLDFSSPGAADVINAWVKDQTRKKIQQIVSPPIDPETIMFLINAIYFKGSWSARFEKDATRDHPFYLAGGAETMCRMMFDTRDFDYFENDRFQAIRLPYGDQSFSMLVFLPRNRSGIDSLVETLAADSWARWRQSFLLTEVKLGLPRFKFEYEMTLNDMLKSMGMEIAFDRQTANFGRMVHLEQVGGQNVFIDEVKHKTFLQVDEEGTEAAAVTSVVVGLTSAMEPVRTPEMIIDHPFLFAIEEKNSGALIFIGKIMHPEWKQ